MSGRSGPRFVRVDRRGAARVRVADLPWLRRASLLRGPAVSLIDLSSGGALFDVPHRLHPGESVQLELVADTAHAISPSRVVRSEVVQVRGGVLLYRGACEFTAPLPWQTRIAPRPGPRGRVETAPPTGLGAYQPPSGWSEAVVVFRHTRRRVRGYVRDFQPHRGVIEIRSSPSDDPHDAQLVSLALLRAVYVLRDFAGAAARPFDRARGIAGCCDAEVVLKNNQIIRGKMALPGDGDAGFWILPCPPRETPRIFVLSSAVADVRLPLATG